MAKNGKWSTLRGKLESFKQPQEWQEKVNEAKAAFIGCDTAELARAFAMTRREKQGLEEQVKKFNTELEALSQLLVDNLEGAEIQKVGLASGECVYLQSEPYATIVDRTKVMGWLKAHKMQSLFTVHWKSFNSLVKELLIDGKAVPPGAEVYLKTSARMTGRSEE